MLTRPKISQPLREAIDEIESWLDGFPRRLPDIFKVAGYAGTGKTTLISQLISRLGEKDVYCAALSGKAAHVMRSKGIKNASTIHSLIYRLEAQPIEKIQQLQRQIERASNIPANGDALRVLKAKLRELSRPSFRLNKDSKLREARLLILDEVSMVGEALAKDVLSFGRPTLVVGDPGQLPPVDGVDAGYFDAIDPDITLTEPQRQEAGSPIVEFATDIRLGRSCRKYGKGVYGIKYEKLSRDELYAWFEKADQVICGLNRNRLRDCCVLEAGAKEPRSKVWRRFESYVLSNDLPLTYTSSNYFHRDLEVATQYRITMSRPRVDGKQVSHWVGLHLLPATDDEYLDTGSEAF